MTLWKNECLGNSGGAIYPLDHVDALDSFESFSVLTWHAVSNDTILLYTNSCTVCSKQIPICKKNLHVIEFIFRFLFTWYQFQKKINKTSFDKMQHWEFCGLIPYTNYKLTIRRRPVSVLGFDNQYTLTGFWSDPMSRTFRTLSDGMSHLYR